MFFSAVPTEERGFFISPLILWRKKSNLLVFRHVFWGKDTIYILTIKKNKKKKKRNKKTQRSSDLLISKFSLSLQSLEYLLTYKLQQPIGHKKKNKTFVANLVSTYLICIQITP